MLVINVLVVTHHIWYVNMSTCDCVFISTEKLQINYFMQIWGLQKDVYKLHGELFSLLGKFIPFIAFGNTEALVPELFLFLSHKIYASMLRMCILTAM